MTATGLWVVCVALQTAVGLSNKEADRRLQQFGPNTLKAGQQVMAFGLLLNQFKSPLVLTLVFAQEWIDAAPIC